MRLLWPTDPLRCIPFHIATPEESGGQGMIGGTPPQGVVPRHDGLRYFLTVPLFEAPKTMASVFVAPFSTLLDLSGQLHPLGAVDVVLHPPAERGVNEALRSGLSPQVLMLEPEESDDYVDEEGTVWRRGDHKIGGRPSLAYQPQQLENDIEQLVAAGFSHVLQVAFPSGYEGPIEGNWPLGERLLHLFAKSPYSPDLWRWCRER